MIICSGTGLDFEVPGAYKIEQKGTLMNQEAKASVSIDVKG